FFQAEDGIRDRNVTGVQTCALPIYSTPDGARAVVSFVKGIIEEQGEKVRLDWHGHQDRGLGVINSIAAIQGGADHVHGSALGIRSEERRVGKECRSRWGRDA